MSDLDDLRRRLERAVGTTHPDVAVANVRAVVGTAHLPDDDEGRTAKEALAALQNGDDVSPRQLAVLEKMIRMMRPAPLVRGGRPDDVDPQFDRAFPAWAAFQKAFQGCAAAIGRIDCSPSGTSLGTGFLVAGGLIVTNTHVLDAASRGTRVLERGQAVVRFGREWQQPDEDPFPVVRVRAVHESLDLALLEIDAPAISGRTPLRIATTAVEPSDGVVAVGYPFNDPVNNPLFTAAIFGRRWGVKRAAPGEVVSVSAPRSALYHDCSTLGGNSGSPILSMNDALVVGLHRGGGFLWRNEAVDGASLAGFVAAHTT